MIYHTFQLTVAAANLTLKFIDVVACDWKAATADVIEAYGSDVEIISIMQKD